MNRTESKKKKKNETMINVVCVSNSWTVSSRLCVAVGNERFDGDNNICLTFSVTRCQVKALEVFLPVPFIYTEI